MTHIERILSYGIMLIGAAGFLNVRSQKPDFYFTSTIQISTTHAQGYLCSDNDIDGNIEVCLTGKLEDGVLHPRNTQIQATAAMREKHFANPNRYYRIEFLIDNNPYIFEGPVALLDERTTKMLNRAYQTRMDLQRLLLN